MKRAVHRAASAVLRAKHAVQNQAADVSGLMCGKTRMGQDRTPITRSTILGEFVEIYEHQARTCLLFIAWLSLLPNAGFFLSTRSKDTPTSMSGSATVAVSTTLGAEGQNLPTNAACKGAARRLAFPLFFLCGIQHIPACCIFCPERPGIGEAAALCPLPTPLAFFFHTAVYGAVSGEIRGTRQQCRPARKTFFMW